MNIESICRFNDKDEKPLDNLLNDGGFCGIFRTVGCIGDSLSSGEFESADSTGKKGYHDYFEYSWGQYIARTAGNKVYNFSRGGMTAREYCESFANENGFWDKDKTCQAYIIAMGVNDITEAVNGSTEFGNADDTDIHAPENSKKTALGYYGRIIAALKKLQPKARFFLMTLPKEENPDPKREAFRVKHAQALYRFSEIFEYTYVLDLGKYAPVYDAEFKKNFYLAGHLNAAGYMLTAKMVMSYIDYIIRHNMEDFSQIGFVGTPFYNSGYKW